MQFRILGTLEAGIGEAAVELGPPKQRAVLAIMLMHVGQILPIDRLIDLLWGETAPRTAAHSVQVYISELRRALDPLVGREVIITRQPGYLLDVPRESVDAWRFERLVEEGLRLLETGDAQGATVSLRAALDLWRGPALSDFAYDEFAQSYIRRFHDIHLDAIEALAGAELDAHRPAEALSLLEAAIREDPLRERSRELLMLALYRTGRHAEALRTFEKLREVLAEELGLDPSPAIRRLRDRILLHDPSLSPVQRAAPAALAERNPYKGLRPFTEDDAGDFFGREGLVGRMLDSLVGGARVVSLVGPSGSGKSSALAAGLVARLRAGASAGSEEWLIGQLVPGTDPLREAGTLLERLSSAADDGRRALLVIDQFEQVFTGADVLARVQLLDALTAAVSQPIQRLSLVLALRADFYDRPLQHSRFAEVFVPGVLHVLPMTASELEAAIVEPAERVGITVEPALLAELVAETAERPTSLPLLQFTLTELFEQRSSSHLTLTRYRSLGGLRGVLSRRAESLYSKLSTDEQQIATHAFLRLIRPGHGAADSRRRVALSELTGLAVDTVALSEVLTIFGRHRLLTFDRDPSSGEATVELAHEAMLTEWERFVGWIDRYRAALRRREVLVAAVDEWDLSGRHPDYLPGGSRLDEFISLGDHGGLQLTTREREFLDAAHGRRQAELARETERAAAQRRLERTANLRLVALGMLFSASPPPAPRVAIAWVNEWGLFDHQSIAGFDRAVGEFRLAGRKVPIDEIVAAAEAELGRPFTKDDIENSVAWAAFDRAHQAELRRLSEEGYRLIIVLNVASRHYAGIAREYPATQYVFAEHVSEAPNVAQISFAEQEAAYLAGAAAALKSESGIIGFVGGIDHPRIWRFQAGYEAGARAVRPTVKVLVEYIGDFYSEPLAEATARRLYEQGARVVLHAAGDAGLGVFEAARALSIEQVRHLWAIGVDSDQYETVVQMPGAVNAAAWRGHILTSVLKNIDEAVYQAVAEVAQGRFEDGRRWTWGLAEGGVDLSYSGGFTDDIRPTLENLKTRIIGGDIDVPCVPESTRNRATAEESEVAEIRGRMVELYRIGLMRTNTHSVD
jgi:basic membrane lipoprotein Med (substrate-binding protein (PBP1-ABC) superfamily)/DNA-binding SARP family transcriptional activator